jgi:hypothetical protein
VVQPFNVLTNSGVFIYVQKTRKDNMEEGNDDLSLAKHQLFAKLLENMNNLTPLDALLLKGLRLDPDISQTIIWIKRMKAIQN